jgi:F-type H+-transporting ATPase subunit delta
VIGTNVARRYARALLEIGSETNTLTALVTEVATLAAAYDGNLELQRALDNPLVTHEAKKAILGDVADGCGVSAIAKHSLFLLGDRRRLHALPAIAQLLREMSDLKQGILRAEVTTAVPLSDAYYAKLQAQLEKMTGQRVAIDKREDPSILAGVIARIGDRVYDGSLRSRMAELGQSLLPN